MQKSNLRNITAVMAKIIEVLSWIGAVCIVLSMIVLFATRDMIAEAYKSGAFDSQSISVTGVDSEAFINSLTNGSGIVALVPFVFFCALSALIFRNIYKVFQKANGDSPFSEANVKRIKNIGYYALAIPVSKIVMYAVFAVIVGINNLNISISLSEVVFGLVALCLAQYFAYGAELQREVDGLL